MTVSDSERQARRIQLVDEHVTLENRQDLEGIIMTFGTAARYDDEPWDAHYLGRDGVRAFYSDLLRALPDLQIDVQRRHVSEETVILEVIIRGRHLGFWRGLPPTGRYVQFPLCGIYTFDDDDRLAGLLRPRHRAPSARCISRAGQLPGPRQCGCDASGNDGANSRANDLADLVGVVTASCR